MTESDQSMRSLLNILKAKAKSDRF